MFKRPASIERYQAIGGVLDIMLFEEAEGNEDEILDAIGLTLDAPDYRREVLRAIGGRRIDEATLFGSWFDPATGRLVARGSRTLADGRKLENASLGALDGLDVSGGSYDIPEAGSGGELAYAFAITPYGLRASPGEIQSLFDDLRPAILPAHSEATILDWSSPRLPEVWDYFEAGMEWWGVFLFSIHIPETRRLTIIAGSDTD
ncbi:hypothetical protein FHS96_004152 [Sphingomonas zeicaulis]|uniref:hypothetical protein n=1 Tax=Sphingomonas zeicaulis TaxID=1632740 RepID=UPI003D2495FD